MNIIGVLAGNLQEFEDWAQNDLILPHPDFVRSSPGRVTVISAVEYRYIPSMAMAMGLELSSVIKIGRWYLRWDPDDIRHLLTRIRI